MKKMKNICLLAFAFSFLTSCGSLSNVPIDQNNNNNNDGTSFNFSEYDFAGSIDSMDSNEDLLGALVKGLEESRNKNVYVGGL